MTAVKIVPVREKLNSRPALTVMEGVRVLRMPNVVLGLVFDSIWQL